MPRIVRQPVRARRLLLAVALAGAVLSAVSADAAGLVCAGGATSDPCVVNTQQSFTNAAVQTFDLGGRALVIASGGRIKVAPGGMNVLARSLDVQANGSLVATGASGAAGTISATVTTDLHVGGTVNASATTTGGQVTFQAGGAIQIDGTINVEGTGTSGSGGLVTTVAGSTTTVSASGAVLADAGAIGGRAVLVSGGDLRLANGTGPRIDASGDDGGSIQLWTTATGAVLIDGILKVTANVNAGAAGRVDIDSAGTVALSSTGIIKAQGGDIGGAVDVDSGGAIQLSTASGSSGTIDVSGRSQAGTIDLGSPSGYGITLGGLVKAAGSTAAGAGGTITVVSGLDVTLSGTAPVSVAGGTSTGAGGEVSIAAATGIAVNGPISATGADGGRIILQAVGGISDPATLDVSAASGFAGLLSLTAQVGDVIIGAPIRGAGPGQGASLDITAHGSITIGATIDLSGGTPDGSGGSFDLHADGAIAQNAAIVAHANGSGCALDSEMTAYGTLSLGAVDVSGDTCAGSLTVAGYGLVTVAGELDGDAPTGFGGAFDLSGGDLRVSGNVHAAGIDAGGQNTLHACDLTLLAGSRVTATGPNARNLLQGNNTLTIGGAVLGGTNALQYAGQAPVVQATGSVLPGTTPVRIANVPCGAPTTTTTSTSSTSTSSTSTSSTSSSSTSTSSTSTVSTTSSSSTSTSSTTSTSKTTSTSSSTSTSSTFATTVTTTPTTSTSSTAPDGSTPTTTVTTSTEVTSTTVAQTSTSTTSSTVSTSTTIEPSTSTSSTTSSSTSTTSTESTSTSTTSTEAPASTTSTTEPPALGCTPDAPDACDDGDPCTDDVCTDGACVNVPPAGVRAVTCPLDVVAAVLRGADPADVGGPRIQARLLAKVAGAQRTVNAGGDGTTPRARAAIKRATRQLNAFVRTVERATDRGTIQPTVGYRLLPPARLAATNLALLTPRP